MVIAARNVANRKAELNVARIDLFAHFVNAQLAVVISAPNIKFTVFYAIYLYLIDIDVSNINNYFKSSCNFTRQGTRMSSTRCKRLPSKAIDRLDLLRIIVKWACAVLAEAKLILRVATECVYSTSIYQRIVIYIRKEKQQLYWQMFISATCGHECVISSASDYCHHFAFEC